MAGSRKSLDYDVVIAGGGMIGTSLALALSPLGLRIAVVEAVARSASSQPSFDDRSTALSRSTQCMFEAMDLWDRIESASTPIRKIHVSEKGRFGFSHIDADEQKLAALGYVVINRVLGEVLQEALVGDASIDWVCPAKITAIDTCDDRATATIEYESGKAREVSCKLIVAADGANSSVRDMMGISASQTQYGQRAIIGNLLPEKPHENVAYERFTDHGPLALLPIADERAAFVWNVDEKDAADILDLDDDAFLSALQDAFGFRLARFSRVGERAAYPLLLSKALRLTATRSVLVGNAAHGLHPVAAQGFNLGMRDVAALCDCIADLCEDSAADIGSAELLARFASWRKADQAKLVQFTDGLVQLFTSRKLPVRMLRNAGMLAFDFVPGVRSEFVRHTMGLAGRLPRLSRGVPLR